MKSYFFLLSVRRFSCFFSGLFLCVLSILGLMGCTEKDIKTPGLSYTQSGPLGVNVQVIQVVSIPDPRLSRNKHGQYEAALLRTEMERWAYGRFVAQGTQDRAVITLSDVSVKVLKDSKPKTATNVTRDFYEGRVDVKLEIFDAQETLKGSITSSAQHTVSIPDTYTVAQREAQLKRFREDLINGTDAKIVKELSEHLPFYITPF